MEHCNGGNFDFKGHIVDLMRDIAKVSEEDKRDANIDTLFLKEGSPFLFRNLTKDDIGALYNALSVIESERGEMEGILKTLKVAAYLNK